MKNKKFLAIALSTVMAFSFAAAFTGCADGTTPVNPPVEDDSSDKTETPAVDTSTPLTGKVYLVGDSTVCSFNDGTYYLPRYGYGTQLYNYINCDSSQIVNLALSGRSSWSFTKENNYTTLTNSIAEGDYLIIGFGHNDQKDDIYTNPNLATDSEDMVDGVFNNVTYSHYASFKRSLYENYIKVAEDKGATAVLCTPIVRANANNDYSGNSAHVRTTSDGGKNPGGDWAQAIRDLGEEKNVDVVDLTELTKTDYTAKGYSEALKYHAATGAAWADASKTEMTATGFDTTHTNLYGAKMNAYYIADALKSSDNSISAHIKTNIKKPDYQTDYQEGVNSKYEIKEYAPFDPATSAKSALGELKAEGWYSTAFGYMGSAFSTSICSVNQNETQDGSLSITVSETAEKLKIASSEEGIVCAFTQLDSNATFTFSTEVTINNYNSHAQSGFGVMLRDDIYIDTRDSSILSNYAAAGVYGTTNSANILYSRVNQSLSAVNKSQTLDTSVKHTLTITRSGKTVTVSFDGMSQQYPDFDVVAVDNGKMYICLYTTRGTSVTFNNVTLTITGTSEA